MRVKVMEALLGSFDDEYRGNRKLGGFVQTEELMLLRPSLEIQLSQKNEVY